MMEQREKLNYIAIDNDGRFVAVITAKRPERIAREISKWARRGLSIERCNDEFVRKHFGDIVSESILKEQQSEQEVIPTSLIKDASTVTGIYDITGGENPVDYVRGMREDD